MLCDLPLTSFHGIEDTGRVMNKRAFERVAASLAVKFPHDGSFSYGIVTDISEKGMCIRSGKCASCDTEMKVIFPMASSNLEVLVKVMRIEKTDDFYISMGVEVIRPSKKYRNMVKRVSTALNSV